MKIKLISIEQGIVAIGFRKIIAIVREKYSDAEIYFVPVANLYSISAGFKVEETMREKDIETITKSLEDVDIVLMSSMTVVSSYAESICARLKEKNPNVYIVWGGMHPTLLPEEAINHVDCICVGEGEKVVLDILSNKPKGIINGPLLTSEEMTQTPFAYNDFDCFIYEENTFKKFDENDYAKHNGLLYRTLWMRGCPYLCSYCANSSLAKISKDYLKLRYSSIEYIINETKEALKKYDFVTTVSFDDDNLIALPLSVIKEFSRQYKEQIGLPFIVTGMHPCLITKEKVECLAKAGMIRSRMGIQTGSESVLKLYNRKTPIHKIIESSNILGQIAKNYHMIPPSYDVITDNPLQTKEDQLQTLELINNLKRPFRITLFSLRSMRKTELEKKLGKETNATSYVMTKPTLANILFYIIPIVKLPKRLLVWSLSRLDNEYPRIAKVAKSLFLFHRLMGHLIRLDFSKLVGKSTLILRRKKQI